MPDSIIEIRPEITSPTNGGSAAFHWIGYGENKSSSSLLLYIERHRNQIRQKYLELINDLGNSRILGKRLSDQFACETDFSLWHMSLLCEKSYWKSPRILDILRIFAIEEVALTLHATRMRNFIPDPRVAKALKQLCRIRGIRFENRVAFPVLPNMSFLKNLYFIRGLMTWLKFCILRLRLPVSKRNNRSSPQRTTLFVSYFANFTQQKDRIYSNYWHPLECFLAQNEIASNWLHIYIPTAFSSSKSRAAAMIERLNGQPNSHELHGLLDSHLTFGLSLKVLFVYLRFSVKAILIRLALTAQTHFQRSFPHWPLLAVDFKNSFSGPVLAENLFSYKLFESALRILPTQRKGFFLYEGQGWEKALQYHWQKAGHGKLCGVIHSSVRFWDLRYFHAADVGQVNRLFPEKTVVNGPLSYKALLEGQISEKLLVKGEALRYMGLGQIKKRERPSRLNTFLLIGDISSASTASMLSICTTAVEAGNFKLRILLKPHPLNKPAQGGYSTYGCEISEAPLENLISESAMIGVTSLTSGIFEAYFSGKSLFAFINPDELNFSPLYGHPEICFVSNSDDFIQQLKIRTAQKEKRHRRAKPSDFFYLNPSLKYWRELLA